MFDFERWLEKLVAAFLGCDENKVLVVPVCFTNIGTRSERRLFLQGAVLRSRVFGI